MKLSVRVDINERFGEFAAAIEISDARIEAFKPVDWVDDLALIPYTGGVLPYSAAAEKVIALRDGAAREISEALTEILINAMKARDTENGYTRGDE